MTLYGLRGTGYLVLCFKVFHFRYAVLFTSVLNLAARSRVGPQGPPLSHAVILIYTTFTILNYII